MIGRLFNTVGPRQTGRYGMVLPTFVGQAMTGAPLTVYGSGEQSRCFGYVGDVVEAIMRLMSTQNSVGEVVNIGNDEEITIKEPGSSHQGKNKKRFADPIHSLRPSIRARF